MKALSDFVLKYDTFLFYPHYVGFGELTTLAIGTQGSIFVDMSPYALIDFNLKHHGASLEGAIAGAKAVLGNIKMPPIVVNKTLGIYWIPMMSPSKEDCVWIALHHVNDYSSAGKGKTEVEFKNGFKITLPISLYSFNKKVQRAYELKGKIESRTRALENFTVEQQLSYVSEQKREYVFELSPIMRNKPMEFSMGMGALKFKNVKT